MLLDRTRELAGKTGRLDTQAAQYKADSADLWYMPAATLESQVGHERSLPEFDDSTTPWRSSYGVVVKSTLFDFGRSSITANLSSLGVTQVNLANTRRLNEDLKAVWGNVLSISEQYWIVFYSSEILRAAEKQLRQVAAEIKQGFRPKREQLKVAAERERIRLNSLRASDRQRQQEASLQRLLQLGQRPRLAPLKEELVKTFVDREMKRIAVRPSALREEAEKVSERIADLNNDLSRKGQVPEITLGASVGHFANGFVGTADPIWERDSLKSSIMLGLTYKFFDFGKTSGDVSSQVAATEAARLRASDLKKQADLEGGSMLEDIKVALQNLEVNATLRSLEEQDFEALAQEYRQGRVTNTVYSTGLTDLQDAKTKYTNALFELARTIVNWHAHEGSLHELEAL